MPDQLGLAGVPARLVRHPEPTQGFRATTTGGTALANGDLGHVVTVAYSHLDRGPVWISDEHHTTVELTRRIGSPPHRSTNPEPPWLPRLDRVLAVLTTNPPTNRKDNLT